MRHAGLLCLILHGTILPTFTVAAYFQKSYQTRPIQGSVAGYEHLPGHLVILLSQQPMTTSKSTVVSSLSDQSHATFHPNLNTFSFHSVTPMQDSGLGRLRQWNVGTLSSNDRSDSVAATRLTHSHPNKVSGGRHSSIRPQEQNVDVQFAQSQSIDITDSTLELQARRPRTGLDHDGGTDNNGASHACSPSRMKRRKTRDTRNAWGKVFTSLLSNLGRSSDDDEIVFRNINTLLGQLTGNNKELSRDMYNDGQPSPQLDVGYKANRDTAKATLEGGRVGPGLVPQPSIHDSVDPDEQRFQQFPVQGSYYYDVLDDVSAEINKRMSNNQEERSNGKLLHGNMYALIKQGPRHTQGVALQDLPQTSSLLRTHNKIDRSQQKEQPLRSFQSSPKGTICDAESDGTMPMRCPSSPDTCLYDSMICDGKPNCPQAEDESFALCVLRHWTFRWFRKFLPAAQRQTTP